MKIVYIYFSFSDQLCTIDSKIDENVETCSDMDIGGPLYIKEEGVGSNQLTPRDRYVQLYYSFLTAAIVQVYSHWHHIGLSD